MKILERKLISFKDICIGIGTIEGTFFSICGIVVGFLIAMLFPNTVNPENPYSNIISFVLGILIFIISAILIKGYMLKIREMKELQEEIIETYGGGKDE